MLFRRPSQSVSNAVSTRIDSLSLRASVRVRYRYSRNTFVERATTHACNQRHPSLNLAAPMTLETPPRMVLRFSRFVSNFRSFRNQPRARRHDGTTARAVAVSARAGAGRKEEPPPGTAESIDLPAVATSTTPATTTPQHTASPNSNKIACTAAHGSPSWKLQDVPGRPGASVAEGAGREANGAEEAEADNNSNEDGVAGEKGQFQEGRTPGTPPGSAVEVALLNVMREAASKREEDERKEKTYASMTDQLDLAVRKTYQNRVQRLLLPSQPPLQRMCDSSRSTIEVAHFR